MMLGTSQSYQENKTLWGGYKVSSEQFELFQYEGEFPGTVLQGTIGLFWTEYHL